MTTYAAYEATCWSCGKASTHDHLGSTSSFGAPDLDLRPSELARSTMSSWAHVCPHCGYVAADIGEAPQQAEVVRQAMAGARWDELTTGWTGPELVARFLRLEVLAQAQGKAYEAGEAALHAAWAADDQGNDELAVACRQQAASHLLPLLSEADLDPEARTTLSVRLVDILRRAGQWAESEQMCREILAQKPTGVILAVLRLQLDLIQQRDRSSRTVPQGQFPAS